MRNMFLQFYLHFSFPREIKTSFVLITSLSKIQCWYTRIMVNKGISFWLSTHYPYFLAGNDTQNTLIFWPMNTQIPLCCSHNWILQRQRVKVKSTNTSFQPKRHWKARVSWWRYSIVTERKHYFAKRIENCLPNNGNSEKK